MSAILSACGTYRYRLDRVLLKDVSGDLVIAYFGVNPSTADHTLDDQSVRKWYGFTSRHGGSRFIVGNPFAYRSRDVTSLARAADPVGPDNDVHIAAIIDEADVLVPCWGPQTKVPRALRSRFDSVECMLRASGKPLKVFGLSQRGDPLHPLMLPYATQLVDWRQAA
ncbi:DUF1643 domain-containing protein [Burkholderia sp. Ac-20365]|uniref:DUF1643 domain-containing protein n=1 Tax=Burkholderia sp. Ac-20365 TaxID=2703897 RepID=UPI00197B279F|nr:DUF1643 domain-containing protein [Burkholderia sp. Ac-20365]MBN3761281.1 DUF1643 domain-containing protein [Burkholderia sp. Ac-20365]